VTRIGLTGGIGSGKSTVAALLAAHGAVVVDADEIARDVVEPGTPGLVAVVAEFGPDVLSESGTLDRARLAQIVFNDPAALQRLNEIVHPLVGAESQRLISAAPAGAVLVYDVPLLVESGLQDVFDSVVVVEAPENVRLERLTARGVDPQDAVRRMANQASGEQRAAVADYVIDNSGALPDLAAQVERVWVAITG